MDPAGPEENKAVRVLYIFGDASNIEQWGGAAMVVNEEGNVWLKKRVTVMAQGLSTKLVEATMIGIALEALLQATRNTEVRVQKVWACVLGVWWAFLCHESHGVPHDFIKCPYYIH